MTKLNLWNQILTHIDPAGGGMGGLEGAEIACAIFKRYFNLFIGNFLGVSMSDLYWFGLQVNLAHCLGSWDVYFLLQGL